MIIITAKQFKHAVQLDAAWAAKLTEPVEVSGYCDLTDSGTHLSSLEWVSYANKVLANVLPHAEWLTGLPIPTPPKPTTKIDKAASKLLDAMDEDDL